MEAIAQDECAVQFDAQGKVHLPAGCGEDEDSADLPWSQTEELLETHEQSDESQPVDETHYFDLVSASTLVVGGLLLTFAVVAIVGAPSSKRSGYAQAVLSLASCFVSARAFNLLDNKVFLFTLGAGARLVAAKRVVDIHIEASVAAALAEKVDKCCV